MYDLVKYVHILCAVVWVGGAIYAQVLAIRVVRSPDPGDLPKLGRNLEYIGTRVFIPASILLFVAGVILTTQRWSFQQTWISIAIVLWLASALMGSLYLGPRSKRVAELFEAEGATSVAGRSLMDRLFLVSRLELVSFLVIVALMVASRPSAKRRPRPIAPVNLDGRGEARPGDPARRPARLGP